MSFTQRQIDIIEAATRLIGEKGIQNMTTKHLAEEIGFSEPALYRHFKGKTEILASVLEYFKDQMQLGLQPIKLKQQPGLEQIRQLIKFQFDVFTKNPAVIMVIFAETSFQYDATLSRAVSRLLNQKRELVISILNKGVKDGSVRDDADIDQIASIILGSMRFNVLQWRLSNFSFDLIKKGDELWKTLNLLIRNRS